MDLIELIDRAQEALAQFNAAEYADAFIRFEQDSAPLFDALADPASEAQALLDRLEIRGQALEKREQKKALDREKRALALYLSPAAERRGGGAVLFSEHLNRLWNERYPKSSYKPGNFDTIMSGFDASFLGIPLKNYVRRG